MSTKDNNQGEGNRDAARNYNEDKKEFIKSGGVEANRDKHESMSQEELAQAEKAKDRAEEKAKS